MIVNRNIPAYLPADDLTKAAEGDIDADAVRAGLPKAGITLSDNDFAGLLTETIEHATRIAARAESAEQLDELDVPRLRTARPAPTASTSAACTNSPKNSPQQGVR